MLFELVMALYRSTGYKAGKNVLFDRECMWDPLSGRIQLRSRFKKVAKADP
jgi:hypothetical protein